MRYLVFTFLLSVQVSFAQSIDFKKENFPNDKEAFKAAHHEYKTGLTEYDKGMDFYKYALKHLKAANSYNPNNAEVNFLIGDIIISTVHREESLKYFEKAYKLDPHVDHDILNAIATAHHLNENWTKAIAYYKKYENQILENEKHSQIYKDYYKEHVDHQIKQCESGIVLVKTPVRVFVDNIGGPVNTDHSEFGPTVTADNSALFFTSKRPGSLGSHDLSEKDVAKEKAEAHYYEDIYVSTKLPSGNWSEPKNMGKPVNGDDHDATVSILPDGQHMIMYNSDNGGDLYETILEGKEWSKPTSIGKTINSSYHEESAAYSLDKKTIYFVSNRPEGNLDKGHELRGTDRLNHDIYYAKWNEKKKRWGEAINMGPSINTIYEERGVFMHADGKTLYFSSEGHNSMGGYDIFKTTYDEKMESWSTPENMGYPVNGPDNDVFFVLTANKRTGYYASVHHNGLGEEDIYSITFLGKEKKVLSSGEDNLISMAMLPITEEIIEPEIHLEVSATTILKGKVLDAVTLKPLKANIDLIDNATGKILATFSSNAHTGNFLVSLPSGKNYGINVNNEKYLFHSENFNIEKTAGYQEVYKEVHLKNITVGSSIVLKNIFFDFDKSTLRTASFPELARLIELLEKVPTMKIEISGHTDSKGSEDYNQKLSEARAKSVVTYLIGKGISKSRLTYVGHGESKPVATNDTDEGRQENRRTEFKIISK